MTIKIIDPDPEKTIEELKKQVDDLKHKLEQSEETSKGLLRQFNGLTAQYNSIKKEHEEISIVESKLRECARELQEHKRTGERDYKKLMELSDTLVIYHTVSSGVTELAIPALIDALEQLNRISKVRKDHIQLIEYAKIVTEKEDDDKDEADDL